MSAKWRWVPENRGTLGLIPQQNLWHQKEAEKGDLKQQALTIYTSLNIDHSRKICPWCLSSAILTFIWLKSSMPGACQPSISHRLHPSEFGFWKDTCRWSLIPNREQKTLAANWKLRAIAYWSSQDCGESSLDHNTCQTSQLSCPPRRLTEYETERDSVRSYDRHVRSLDRGIRAMWRSAQLILFEWIQRMSCPAHVH